MADDWNDKTSGSPTRRFMVARSGKQGRPVVLRQIQGPGMGRSFLVGEQEVVLGRGEQADIKIDSVQVSRRHLLIRQVRAGYRIEDQRSRNGTLLNGVPVHAAILSHGDRITVGEAVFEFEEGR